MSPDEFTSTLHVTCRTDPEWFELAALDALRKGYATPIIGCNDSDLYLYRFWLSAPLRSQDGDRWDSQGSILLHYFARGDDDEALHDHPWAFQTTILRGGYDEHLPPYEWVCGDMEMGPPWREDIRQRRAGDTIERYAEDLHCVGRVQPGTWTLVRTGHREREWGFHPEGRPWIPWREYLGVAS